MSKQWDDQWGKMGQPVAGSEATVFPDHQSLTGHGDYPHDEIDDLIMAIRKSYADTFPSGITLGNDIALTFQNNVAANDAYIKEGTTNILTIGAGSLGVQITPGALTVGTFQTNITNTAGGIQAAGALAGLFFIRRDLLAWPGVPVAGDNYAWYSPDNTGAYLWTNVSGNIFKVGPSGGIWTLGENIEVNFFGTGNRNAYVDLHGDDTYTDYGARFIRYNTGANAATRITHRGTGELQWYTEEDAVITGYPATVKRFSLGNDGDTTGMGFNETPLDGNVSADGARIYFDSDFLGGTTDYLVIEKTDGNATDPDGGIAFTMKGNDNVRETAMTIDGNCDVNVTGGGDGVFFLRNTTDGGQIQIHCDSNAGADQAIITVEGSGAYVGINKIAPICALDIVGTVAVSVDFSVSGQTYMPNMAAGAGTGDVRASMGVGAGQLLYAVSSKRYKNNIEDYREINIEDILKLRPVSFVWNEKTATPNVKDFGLIAEEVNKIFPEIVGKNKNNEPDNVNYKMLSVILLSAIKDLHTRLQKLEEGKTLPKG